MALVGIDGERKSGIDIRAEHVTVLQQCLSRLFQTDSATSLGDNGHLEYRQIIVRTSRA